MSKRDFNKSSGYSFCPRSSAVLGQEFAEEKIKRVGKGAYYAGKGRIRADRESAVDPDYLAQERKRRQRVKLRKDRLQLIKEMAELNKL